MILNRASEHERRYVNIVFFVFGLLIVVAAVKGVVLWYYEKHWNEIVPVENKQLLNDVAEAIRGTQRRCAGCH
jgi:hypothetical protein